MLASSRRWPGPMVLATIDSRPPVPDAVRTMTSYCVWNAHRSPATQSRRTPANCGPRWAIISRASASRTAGGSGVGPGVRRFRAAIAPTIPEPSRGEVTGQQQQTALDRHACFGIVDGLVADRAGIAQGQRLALQRPTQAGRSNSLDGSVQRYQRDDLARLGPPGARLARAEQAALVVFVEQRDG